MVVISEKIFPRQGGVFDFYPETHGIKEKYFAEYNPLRFPLYQPISPRSVGIASLKRARL